MPYKENLDMSKKWSSWQKNALYGGTDLARLEKTLPDEDPHGNLDNYQKIKEKDKCLLYT